ncbi:solute carrier family 35 member F4 [Megalops cyprinoides]|uniref:solute carrier family 35 member F4 n=1 Tax=Megalops cyprinoides TaxID=118141 RepID=UPI0018647054|nr:solute carrier family 35 member F4 [Megalops cyprinoides]
MSKLTAKVSPSPCSSPQTLAPPAPAGEAVQEGGALSETAGAESGGRGVTGCCARCPLAGVRRVAWGVVLAGGIALSWAGGTHSARQVLQTLHAPFFITWFCSIWNLLIFPLYYLGHLVGADQRQWPMTRFRQCSEALGSEGMTLRAVLRGSAPFSVLWSLSTYLYLLALCRIPAGDASAVLCCSQAFCFLLSWIGLRERFMGVRIVAAILSITGIVMMAYADGFHSDSITGVALGVGSASTSALYKVLLKRRVGQVRPGVASVLLSCVGLCGSVLHSWLCVLLYLTHVEYWPTTQHVPWDWLCVLASLLLAFNMLVNLGSVLTYPTLISLGVLLSVPASTAVDFYLTAAAQLSQVRVAAAGIIGAGYLLLQLPEHWDESALRWLGGLWHGGWREDGASGEDAASEAGATARAKPKPAGVAALP